MLGCRAEGLLTVELEERFWSKVDWDAQDEGRCWEWTAALCSGGYGAFMVSHTHGRTMIRAHRIAYELEVGPIPAGLHIDHLCRKRSCVNPRHLEPVTCGENVRRGNGGAHWAAKTHCPYNHEYTPENVYVSPGQPGSRHCRACRRVGGRG